MLWEPLALAALNQPAADRRGHAVRARAGGDVRRGPAGGVDRSCRHGRSTGCTPSRPARTSRRTAARSDRAPRRACIWTAAGRIVAVGAETWTPRAVIAAVPWFALPELFTGETDAARRHARRRSRDGGLADRDGQSVVRSAGPGRAVRRASRTARCSGCSTSGWCSAIRPPTCRSSRAARRRSSSEIERGADCAGARGAAGGAAACRLGGAAARRRSIREPRATFSLAPGQPPRPETRTAVPGLYLAGDWIATGLPATIESAVRSGHRAADSVSTRWLRG